MDAVATLLAGARAPDPAWAERVRALDAPSRRALRRRALEAVPPDLDVAREVVAALPDEVDPRDPHEAATLKALLEVAARDPRLEPVFRRAATGSADVDLELEAALLGAQLDAARGLVADAERAYVALLPRVEGSGRRAERVLLLGYARLCLDAHRDLEALVLARRAATLMAAAGDAWGHCLAQLHVTGVLLALEDWERLEEALLELEPVVARLPDAQRHRAEASVDGRRAMLAVERGDAARGFALIDAAEAKAAAGPLPPGDPRTPWLMRARAHVALRQPAEARRCVATAAPSGPHGDRVGLALRAVDLEARVAERDPAVLADVEAFLNVVDGPAATRVGPGLRLYFGDRLARALDAWGVEPKVAARARATAVGACLERLTELHRFLRAMPTHTHATPDDVDVFRDHQRRALSRWGDLHAAVVDRIRTSPDERRAVLAALANPQGLVTVCAWCGHVRHRDGAWVPVQAFVPIDLTAGLPVTHGICVTCAPRVHAELDDLIR